MFSGLLNMLEEYPDLFEVGLREESEGQVNRVPKNDFVTLITNTSQLSPTPRRYKVRAPMNRPKPRQDNLQAQDVARRPISRCLHVGNVGVKATEEDLELEFGEFGEIEDIKIVHQGGRCSFRD